MMNILVASTSVVSYWPILEAFKANDMITGGIITLAASSSFVSHLFESHKHNMWGFGMPSKLSYLLNRVDVAGVGAFILRMLWLLYENNFTPRDIFIDNFFIVFQLAMAYYINLMSEKDPGQQIYVPYHCIWHGWIFMILYQTLGLIYRKKYNVLLESMIY